MGDTTNSPSAGNVAGSLQHFLSMSVGFLTHKFWSNEETITVSRSFEFVGCSKKALGSKKICPMIINSLSTVSTILWIQNKSLVFFIKTMLSGSGQESCSTPMYSFSYWVPVNGGQIEPLQCWYLTDTKVSPSLCSRRALRSNSSRRSTACCSILDFATTNDLIIWRWFSKGYAEFA